MSKTQILLLILAFVVLTFGSFIWMIATWDASTEKSISGLPDGPAFAFSQILPPEAPTENTRVSL